MSAFRNILIGIVSFSMFCVTVLLLAKQKSVPYKNVNFKMSRKYFKTPSTRIKRVNSVQTKRKTISDYIKTKLKNKVNIKSGSNDIYATLSPLKRRRKFDIRRKSNSNSKQVDKETSQSNSRSWEDSASIGGISHPVNPPQLRPRLVKGRPFILNRKKPEAPTFDGPHQVRSRKDFKNKRFTMDPIYDVPKVVKPKIFDDGIYSVPK